MRRLATFAIIAVGTAVTTLWWLHDGDLAAAVEPVMAEWDADLLARNAGIATDTTGQPDSDTLSGEAETPPVE